MSLVSEKIVVTAKEFLESRNINDSYEFNDPLYQTKIKEFEWDLSFSASSVVCEIIWLISMRGSGSVESRQLHRLFSPSPIATHANFRGNKRFRTGNVPELGAIAVWRKGNSWQGDMAIVTNVYDNVCFDVITGRVLQGSENKFLRLEEKKNKRTDFPNQSDRYNLLGFIYPPYREIS